MGLKSSILLISIVLTSCIQDNTNNCFFSIPKEGWVADSAAHFRLSLKKNEKRKALLYQITYDPAFPWENIWLQYHFINPEGDTIKTSTDNLYLFDRTGKPMGRGTKERVCLKAYFLKDFHSSESGEFKISVSHKMRCDTLKGIVSLGLLKEEN